MGRQKICCTHKADQTVTNKNFQINNFKTFSEEVERKHCNTVASYVRGELEKRTGMHTPPSTQVEFGGHDPDLPQGSWAS